MAWPIHRSSSFHPDDTAWNEIVDALSTWGGNTNAGGYNLSNVAALTIYTAAASVLALAPGALPGTAYTVTGASWSGSVATVTIGAHAIPVGRHVTVASITPSGYNQADVVVTAVTGTAIKYALASNPGAWSSGGTVTADGSLSLVAGMLAFDGSLNLSRYSGSAWGGVTSSGYTPEGTTVPVTVTVGTFNYTNSSAFVEYLKIHGDGVLTSVSTDSASWPLEFPMDIVLYPGQLMQIISTVAPTVIRKR